MFRRVSTWDQQPQEWADVDITSGLEVLYNAATGTGLNVRPTLPKKSAVFHSGRGALYESGGLADAYQAPLERPVALASRFTFFAVARATSVGASAPPIFGLRGSGGSATASVCFKVFGSSNFGFDIKSGGADTASTIPFPTDGAPVFCSVRYDGTNVIFNLGGAQSSVAKTITSATYDQIEILYKQAGPDLPAAGSGLLLGGYFGRCLTDAEIANLSANPWQLFVRREWVFSNVAAGGGGGNVTVSISGLGASALAGNLAPSLSASISGAAASLAAGNVGVSRSVAASGVSATGQVGSLKAALSVALSGLQATGGIGTVTAQIAGNVTVSISGVSATVQAGTVVPALAISVTGLSSTSAVGSVTRSQSVGITGIQSAAQAGTVTSTGGVEQVKSKGLRKTRYTPGRVPSDAKELARFIQNELERLTDALESPFTHQLLEVLHAEPSRKSGEAAMVAYADGTDWNPGAGRGLYLYDPQTAAWTKL